MFVNVPQYVMPDRSTLHFGSWFRKHWMNTLKNNNVPRVISEGFRITTNTNAVAGLLLRVDLA